jgi:hypothetical protein
MNSLKPEGLTNRNRVSHSRLWLIRRNYYNFSEIFNSLNQVLNAWRSYSIIISYEDDGFLFARCLFWRRFAFSHMQRKSATILLIVQILQ